jgi:hypothetical protein
LSGKRLKILLCLRQRGICLSLLFLQNNSDLEYQIFNKNSVYEKDVNVFLLCSLSPVVFAQEHKNITNSKMVINSFQKAEYPKIVEVFDVTMKNALPEDKLKLVWEDLNNKCGKFQKYSEITEDKIQTYNVTYVLCHFEKMNLQMKLVYNDKNQIAGLFFIPENQK